MPNLKDTTTKRLDLTTKLETEFGRGGDVPIISTEHYDLIEHKAGVNTLASPYIAAKMIFKHTHRLATDEEAEQGRKELQFRTDELARLAAEAQMRQGKFAVISDPRAATNDATAVALTAKLNQLQSQLAAMQAAEDKRSAENRKPNVVTVPGDEPASFNKRK